MHCTHWPEPLQTWPDGHGWFALQPGTQEFCWHSWPRGHCESITQVTQVLVAVSQTGLPGVVQSPLPTQPTQVFVAGLQMGRPGVVHCALVVHCTQRPKLASHIKPLGQTGCCAEQPGTQTSAWQTRPGPQCASRRHSTQPKPSLQNWPSSQTPRSLRQPATHAPSVQTEPAAQASSVSHCTQVEFFVSQNGSSAVVQSSIVWQRGPTFPQSQPLKARINVAKMGAVESFVIRGP